MIVSPLPPRQKKIFKQNKYIKSDLPIWAEKTNPFTRDFRVLFCKLVEKNFTKILPFLDSYFSDNLRRLTRKLVMKRILDYGL